MEKIKTTTPVVGVEAESAADSATDTAFRNGRSRSRWWEKERGSENGGKSKRRTNRWCRKNAQTEAV